MNYSAFPHARGVPAKMRAVVPDAKLVYLVRDPIERLVSTYVHLRSDRREERPLSKVLEEFDGSGLIDRSRYFFQLEQYLPHYDDSQIHVVSSEELRRDPATVMSLLYSFLSVDPSFRSPAMYNLKHESRHKRRKSRFAVVLSQVVKSRPARMFSPEFRRNVGRWVYRPFSSKLQRPEIDPGLRERLQEFFAPDVKKLRELTGMRFSEWSV